MGRASTGGDQWAPLIARMQKEQKFRVPEHDRELMERYLIAFSSTAPKPLDAGVGGAGVVEGAPRASVH